MRNVFLALTLLCNYILANFWHVAAKCAKIEHLEKQNKNFSESYKFHDKNMLNCETILSWIHLNTSSAGCLETCPSTGRRPTVYTWPAYDILVLHFKCQPLSAGSYVFLYTVRHFIQVSCKQKHIYNVRWCTVWSGEHFKATVVYFACSHACVSQSAAVTMWLIVSSHCISLGAVSNVMWINNHSEIFLLS